MRTTTTTAERRLDYYGPTINVTVRFESLCRAGEIVLAHSLLQASPPLQSLIRRHARELDVFKAQLKGVQHELILARVVAASLVVPTPLDVERKGGGNVTTRPCT